MSSNIIHLVGRVLMAFIFIAAGAGKLGATAGTAGYMQSMGVPSALLWPTIALEILGGIALLVGYRTKWVAWALAAFTLVAGLIFHHDFANQMQQIMFMKNLAIVGGLLILSVASSNPLSFDQRKA